jgi:hypothetical protein
MSNFLELKSTPTSLVAERNKLEGMRRFHTLVMEEQVECHK